MFERVILHSEEGELKGQAFVLENETSALLGRSRDCSHRLLDMFYMVSRFHCRIKVFAPLVYVQDLGSLNGTFINGVKIGQRGKDRPFEEILQTEQTEHLLWDGDELCIGSHVFRVEFDPPPPRTEVEILDREQLWSSSCPVYR